MKRVYLFLILMLAGCHNYSEPAGKERVVNRYLVEPDMVRVPDTKYSISVVPVSNEQYQEFLRATGRTFPPIANYPKAIGEDKDYPWRDLLWTGNRPPNGRWNHPVVLVSKSEATAYCDWLSTALGKRFVLPTEDVYQKAMKGADGVSPGLEALKTTQRKETLEGTIRIWFPLTPVGKYPQFRSGIGCYVQGQSFYEWILNGVAQPSAWHSTNKLGWESQRYLFEMHGPGSRLCVMGFRVATRTEE
ncbi:MAG: SUMF1/EgtB/PvdO family nonheme iron enzyme [Lentisphaerae bacterium]|nr:SUMF1/EgtB/PvdO family nonheme iron enzyme [Lentisphaerota bacterium]